MRRSRDPVPITTFHSVRTVWLFSRSACGNCPAVLYLWVLAVCRCVCAGKGPEILLGAVIVVCFYSVDVLQANSEERAVLPAVGLSLLPVLQLLSVACGCCFFFFFLLDGLMWPALSIVLMQDASGKLEPRSTL